MKKLLLLVCFLYVNWANAQTINIGAGANSSGSVDLGNPILVGGTTGNSFSQSVQLLTASDLTGLQSFATITSFGFVKANASTLQAGRSANLKIYMKNTTNNALVEYKNFDSWITGATLVYSNANFSNANMPAAVGLVLFSCNNFVYLGSSVEIYIDWTRNGVKENFATGAFLWAYDDDTVIKSVGLSNQPIATNNLNCKTDNNRRFQTSITYVAPTACTVSAPGATISTNTNPIYGDNFTLSLSNYQTGTSYHWYNSAGPIANAFGATYTATANFTSETYYCKVNCSVGTIQNSTSIIINPIQPISTFPFIETFDDNSPTAAGWKKTLNGLTFNSEWNSITYNSNFNINPADSSKFMFLNSLSNNGAAIESPEIQLPSTAPQYKELSYKYNTNNSLLVQISVNGSAFSTLYSHDSSNSLFNTEYNKPWSTNTIGLNAYDGENIKIRFIALVGHNQFSAIDEVSIKDSPIPCSTAPNPPTIEVVSTNESKVHFAAVAGKTYVVEYGLSGFTPGTDSGAGVGGMVLTTSASPLLITPLQAGQTYDVYIRERCPVPGLPGTFSCSNNSGVISFNTCQATSVPYTENFETANVPGLAACTSGLNAGSGNLWDTQNTPGFGFTSKALRYNQNFTNDANAWFFTRAINLQEGVNYVIRYKYGISDQGYVEKMKVAYGTSATASGMTLPLSDHPLINVTGLQRVSQVFTPSTTGVYSFGFNCYSDAQQDRLYVDDISVVTEESTQPVVATTQNFCDFPSPKVSDLVATGVNIKWYASLATTVVMPQSIALNNNQTYYVTQTIDGFESSRVAVQIFIRPRPTVIANQNVCTGKTLADLQVTGTNLKWYNASLGGTLIPATTVVSNTTYYVSQTVAGTGTCESSRATVNVTVSSPTIIAPIAVTACRNYQWSENGQTYNSSGTYTFLNGNCEHKTLNLTINSTTWSNTTWSNGEPNANTKAIFSSNYTATTDLIACSVAVSGTANVIFPSNLNLTVTNEIIVGASSTLTFENNSNLIQINAATNTGNIVYRRNAQMNRLDYVYWSSPVANQKLLAFTPNTLPNRFYTYNEPTKLFTQVASPLITNFDLAKGYSLRAPNNFFQAPAVAQTFVGVFTGVPNNGNISVPVTFTASPTGGIGFNLIGNPYPSTVNATTFLNDNLGSLYFWTHQSFYDATNVLVNGGVNNYATFNLSGAVAASITNGVNVVPNGTIQAGQGFMFLTTSSKNVTFTNAMRIANNADQFFRTAEMAENDKLWLNLTNYNASSFSQTMVAYLPNTTSGFDDGYDARQLNTSGNVLSSKIADVNYAIQSRGSFVNSDVVKLNLNIVEAGSFTLSNDHATGVFNQSQDYFLKDNLLGTTHNIKQTPYNFVANAGATANRFEIVYQGALSNNNNVFASESVIVFEQNGNLNVFSKDDLKNVKVFDVQGRNIFEMKDINTKSSVLKGFRPQQQVLLLQIMNSDNQIVTKKVLF